MNDPLTADQVREHIAETKAKTKCLDARRAMARLAIKHGNITPEGKSLWAAYLESGK